MALRCVAALVDPEILPDPVAILEQRIAEDDITLYPSGESIDDSKPEPIPDFIAVAAHDLFSN